MKRLLIFFGCILALWSMELKPVSLAEYKDAPIRVHIEGEVEHPGTYELERYTQVSELLEKAGVTEYADTGALNDQTVLKDRDSLVIPARTEEPRISINTADVQELCRLEGIGEKTARKIIEYRNEHGLFSRTEDLMRVSGIGEKKYEKLKEKIGL